MELESKDELTTLLQGKGINSWPSLLDYIRQLPYGRTSNRKDLGLVLVEEKGTCSSKHALLKKIADLNNIPKVNLVLGMYKMMSENTPGIGKIIEQEGLPYIPEAHCYLKIAGIRYDFTTPNSSLGRIERDLLEEQEIEPNQIITYKVNYHKRYLESWLQKKEINKDLEEIWNIRESCIRKLSDTT